MFVVISAVPSLGGLFCRAAAVFGGVLDSAVLLRLTLVRFRLMKRCLSARHLPDSSESVGCHLVAAVVLLWVDCRAVSVLDDSPSVFLHP